MGNLYGILMIREHRWERFTWSVLGRQKNDWFLGRVKVDKKSNEITAIPELLKVLEVSGCIVTIDAMGCQKEIVKLLAEENADYVITLKKNQGQLYKNVDQLFKEAIRTDFQGILHSAFHTREQAHGREEIRHYLMLTDITGQVDPNHKWQKLISYRSSRVSPNCGWKDYC